MDDPTKFSLSLTPFDYLYVASNIFDTRNLNNDKNGRPETFDLFEGNFQHRDGKIVRYRLLIYKGTKIIHTLFISNNKKPFNKKKILDLRQGWAYGSHDFRNGIQTFNISFYNKQDIELYKIIIRFSELDKTERWYIQKNSEIGIPFLTTYVRSRKLTNTIHFAFRSGQLDFENIEWAEKIIKQIIDKKYNFWKR